MCNSACIDFVRRQLGATDVAGRRVLEVGSLNVNGTVRPYVEGLGPELYFGVDIEAGPGVDEVCDVRKLLERFGESSFDVVISTEMLEHVEDWREVISILKRVVRVDGLLVITTRSPGFGYHGYPYDFWRFEVGDMERIFSQCDDVTIETDPLRPGVFVKARRPSTPWDSGYEDLAIQSIITGSRVTAHSWAVIANFRLRRGTMRAARRVLPNSVKRRIPTDAKRRIRRVVRGVS